MANQHILPPEILQKIVSYLAGHQSALHVCTLVSTLWYKCAVPLLYSNPAIDGKNFDKFVRAICPSINAHVRVNGLAALVRRLDMSLLVHNGSKSLTARLLGRVKGNLEDFVAPQASFAVNCLAALSKCSNLRRLDLSLVSESIAMSDLLRSTSTLSKLEILYLPRSSTHGSSEDVLKYDWPTKLRELYISGGIRDESVLDLSTLPRSLIHLSISNCPHLSMLFVGPLLKHTGSQLQYLEITAPIPGIGLGHDPLTNVTDLAPNLRHLKISLDFVGPSFFTASDPSLPECQFLNRLDLDCFDPAENVDFRPERIADAIVGSESKFTKLRKLGVHHKLGWMDTKASREAVAEIDELLKALAREDGPDAEIPEAEAGVVFFGTR